MAKIDFPLINEIVQKTVCNFQTVEADSDITLLYYFGGIYDVVNNPCQASPSSRRAPAL